MCMMLYMAADQPVPEIPWNESEPAFHVRVESPGSPVRNQFALPHLFYVGSHEGCGCGFQLGEYPGYEDDEALAKGKSLRDLAGYLEFQLAEGRKLTLYACWAGDEASAYEHCRTITPRDLLGESFFFLEKELVRVEGAA